VTPLPAALTRVDDLVVKVHVIDVAATHHDGFSPVVRPTCDSCNALVVESRIPNLIARPVGSTDDTPIVSEGHDGGS
jgi:hypothetical protein